MFLKKSFLLAAFMILMGAMPLSAQLNLKIGYSLSLFNPQQTNAVLQRFNAENPWLERSLNDLNWMSGFTVGFRNRWEVVALEVAWHTKFTKEKAEGTDPTNTKFNRTNLYRLNAYSVGLEIFPGGNFSFGGTIDATDMIFNIEGTGFAEREKVVDGFSLGSHFFVSYEIPAGEYMAVAFRPYIQMPWATFNVQGLERAYFPDSTAPEEDFEEDMVNFGIMFIFYNGVQPN
jgi:hypothetical protein